jgi:GT2 family glycosyltransferase
LNKDAEIAVIVITYNGKRHLKECFNALLKQTCKNFEIYLLDNASSDGSSSFVRANFPQVKIIRFEQNYGFAEGYNRAINRVDSKYVVLLNDDTRVDSKWLEELTTAMNKGSKILAGGSKILFYNHPNLVQHAGGKLTFIGAGMDIGFGDEDCPAYDEPKNVGTVCGCGMIINKEFFERLGGFDDQYFAYFEDVDLCWRGWLQGYKTIYVPSSILYHKFGGSWGDRYSHNRIYYGTKNRFANIVKNLSAENLFLALYSSVITDFVKLISFLLRKQPDNVSSMLKAYYQTLRLLPNNLRIRFALQVRRSLSDKDLFNLGLFSMLPESLREFRRLQKVTLPLN